MRRAVALCGFVGLFAALSVSFTILTNKPSRAAPDTPSTFMIPAGDGYGVAECLNDGKADCGRVIADAWCEAHGFVRAERFGLAEAEDVTGTVETVAARDPEAVPLVITCAP